LQRFGLFRAKNLSNPSGKKNSTTGNPTSKSVGKVGVAEKKLLLIFLYYFLLAIVSYTGFSLFHRKVERYSTELMTYFMCEQYGHDPMNPCSRSAFEFLAFPGATAVAYIVLELSPLVSFVFIINYKELKASFRSFKSSSGTRSATKSVTAKYEK
jgi:hypothetical protein